MTYTFIDASGNTQTADSSVVSGVVQRPVIQIGSVLTAIPTTFTGSPSISGTVNIGNTPSVNGNVTGSVLSIQSGAWNNSVAGAVQIAGASPASVMTITRLDNQVIGSMQGLVGQVVIHGLTSAGGGSYVDVKVDPSGALVTAASSVVAFQGGTQISSLVSTVPSSVLVGASIFGALPAGNAVLGAVAASITGTPNVAITSIATANGGLPIFAPLGSRVQGTADFRGNAGASIAVIAGAGASTRNYVDHVQVMNFGSASVLVTIADNTTSVLGYTIAPAGGGSNYDAFYRGAVNSPITASISGQASVLVSMQGFTSGT